MGLHIELTGDMTATELDAVAALIAVLRGKPSPVEVPGLKPNVHGIGPDEGKAKTQIPAPPKDAIEAGAKGPPIDVAPGADLVDTTEEFTPPDPAAPTPELDANGIPWDGRIHASTKTLKADKTWTAKRNVAADLVTSVTAELKQNMAAAAVKPGVPLPPAEDDDGPLLTDHAQAFGGRVVESPPVAIPAPPAEETKPAADDPMAEFARVMRVVTEKQKAGIVSTTMATSVAQQLGLTDIRGLATRPDLIPAFEALLP